MVSTKAPTAPHEHVVRFYEDDSYLCDAVGRFLLEGLEQGEAVVIIAGKKHRSGVNEALAAAGIPILEAKLQGRIVELDAEETLQAFMPGDLARGLPDRDRFRAAVGSVVQKTVSDPRYKGMRAYGQMVDILSEFGNEDGIIRLEEFWNELARDHSFRLQCGYSIANFRQADKSEVFRRVCGTHSQIIPSESYDENADLHAQRCQVAELQQRAFALEAEVGERMRLDRQLRDEQARLREANRRKDEFFALLSHELRNPLAPILTSLDVMDLRGDESSRHEREIIRRQASHLAGLVEDLLDVSRVIGGKVELRKEMLEISAVVGKAIEMASPLLEQRGHQVNVRVPQEGLVVEGDSIRLPQVVTNLLTNAAKYTPVGGRISVNAERRADEIVISVQDNGIGIQPESLATLFEPFVQVGRSLDRSLGGLGLGLALVRSFTLLHGGSVAAYSDGAGMGSRFVVRLPAASTKRGQAKTVSNEQTRTRNGNAKGRGSKSFEDGVTRDPSPKKVLVVDDNIDGALALADVIRRLGYEVRVAHDGPQALSIARAFIPDAALIDLGLPIMDGYEVARQLRAEATNPLRLIAVTGYGQDEDRARSATAGFDLHLVKPVDLGTLKNLLPSRVS